MLDVGMLIFGCFLFFFGVYILGRLVRLLNLLIKYLEQCTK